MRTIHILPSFLLLGGAITACGGQTSGSPGGGSGSLSGTVANTTFQVASVIAAVGPSTSDSSCISGPDGGESCTHTSSGQTVFIVMTNRPDADCAYVQSQVTGAPTNFANLDLLLLGVGSQTTVAPGTYTVTATPQPQPGAGAQLETTTATCATGLNVGATGGTITLTQVGADQVTGSYSVTFGSQGSFTGSFDVQTCILPDAGPSASFDAGALVCKP